MPSFLTDPFALACAALLAALIFAVLAIPRLFSLFKQNSFTGQVTAANRDFEDNLLILDIQSLDGRTIRTFYASGSLGDEIERRLIAYRRERRNVTVTVVYDPSDSVTITEYTMVTH